MKTNKVYIYLNSKLQVVYCNYLDNNLNSINKNLKKFIISESDVKLFVKYFELQLHPVTKLNTIK